VKTPALLLSGAALLFALPTFAATISFTAGCTSTQPGLSSTLSFGAAGTPNATDPAGHATYQTPTYNAGTDPGCGGSFLSQNGSSTTILFDAPIIYFGLVWGTNDTYNTITLFNGANQVAVFAGAGSGTQGYANISAGAGEQFTRIVMNSTSCCFETDNHSYILAATTATPEPSTIIPMLCAAAASLAWTWRQRTAKPSSQA
jgi:hypothetical protein